MKRSYLIAAVLAILVGGWILSGQVNGNGDVTTEPGTEVAALNTTEIEVVKDEKPLPRVRVRTVSAEARSRDVVLFGRTEANRSVEIKAETSGRVERLPLAKGAEVEEGAELVGLSMDDRKARLREAEALVNQRHVAYTAAKKLTAKNFRSKVQLAEESANLASARAALATIKLDIERTTTHAPFAGVVDDFLVEIGDYVESGDVLARLVDLDPLHVVAEVAERDVTGLEPGGTARATLLSGETVEGTVTYVSRAGTSATRTFRVEVAVPNPEGRIAQGLTTEVRLSRGSIRAHRLSPAVLTLDDSGKVGVKAIEDGRVEFHPVKIIDDTPNGIWVSGLPETVTVITVGQEFVLDGQRAVAVDEASIADGVVK